MSKFLRRLGEGAIGILLGANVFTIVLLWGCIACAYIPSGQHPRLSLACLAFPIFLLCNLCFVLMWTFVRRRLAFLSLLAVLLASPYIFDYCPIHFNSRPPKDAGALCIVTFNAGRMTADEFDALTEYLERVEPDIVCMQEFNSNWKTSERAVPLLESNYPYRLTKGGREIHARFPLEEMTDDLPFPTRSNGCMQCWVDIEGERVALFNIHLESNHLEDVDKQDYRNALKNPDEDQLRQSGRLMAGKLSEAASYRGQQTDELYKWLTENPEQSVIVCGDFNDTPISYTCQHLGRLLRSAYRESGSGVGFSYNQKGFPVRIDHVFYSPDWTSLYSEVDHRLSTSDHYPLVTYIKRK